MNFLLCVFSLSFLVLPIPAQEKSTINWETNYEAAFQKATKENKPVFIAVNMDDETANDETAKQHYVDPEIVALSHQMICLIASSSHHGPDNAPCPRFGTVTCAQHQAIEKKMRANYVKTPVVRAPQHIFCQPNGVEMFRKVFLISKQELKKAMSVALSHLSKGATNNDLAKAEREHVDKLLQDAESKSAQTRNTAFHELGVVDDPRGIPTLLEKAKPGNAEVDRYMAIHSLGKKGNYGAVKPLLDFLQDKNSKIVIYAIAALGEIELPDPMSALLGIFKNERNDRLRSHAIYAVARCVPENIEVQKACISGLSDSSVKVQTYSLLGAFALKPDPKIAAAIQPMMESKNMSVRGLAVWVAGKEKNPSLIPMLEKISKEDKAPKVAEVAAKALAYAKGEKNPEYEGLSRKFFEEEELDEGDPDSAKRRRNGGDGK